ncbi:DUF222 domain-containing protein [Gordonia sp. TBRC 11910]|uniref:DUF222 domain-containing protein n=2 Tax=Gordonia asplenii TaxID=2725283 RepID=A0A848KZT5_9ACTN|nr:DUF222 domain-containing protein [Gordonia asplenii]
MFDDTEPAVLSDDELSSRVIGYASQIAALTSRFLDHIAEFDVRKIWVGAGIYSTAHWLSWFTGLALRTAQDYVRVARVLQTLPILHDRLATGRLSYSKVRAITRVHDIEAREEELARFAESASAGQIEKLVKSLRTIDRGARGRNAAIDSRCTWKWDADGTLVIAGRLNPVDGARLLAGLVRAEYERTRVEGDPDLPRPVDEAAGTVESGDGEGDVAGGVGIADDDPTSVRRDLWRHVPSNIAPALVGMADLAIDALDMPEMAPGAEILVHEIAEESDDLRDDDASEVASEDATREARLDDGPALDDNQRDEMRCGATVRNIGHHRSRRGPTLWWGKKRRVPNAALVRVVTMRDRSCRHPGCGRTRFLHMHHVKFWSQGGTTDPDNLLLLCSEHHRALHNGAFSIEALGLQQFRFYDASGRVLLDAPQIHAPGGWEPDERVAADGVVPKNGGRLQLGYATEVLYAAWAWKARRATPDVGLASVA